MSNVNYVWAVSLFNTLVAGGVSEAVISPGSRSTPLALAAARHPKLRSQVILDERSAAFFALGIARVTGRPTALIATSGTAVSEWLPAAVEADQARVPLILLSADRPPELHQCGANQTIEQRGLFASRVRLAAELPLPQAGLLDTVVSTATRAVAAALWPLPGPVHLNIPFREPLIPGGDEGTRPVGAIDFSLPHRVPDEQHIERVARTISGKHGLIVCGPEQGQTLPAREIADLAKALGAPVLADPLSNLRSDSAVADHRIALYDLMLRQPSFAQSARPEWVLHLGATPVSKVLGEYLAGQTQAQHIRVDISSRWSDPQHQCNTLIVSDPSPLAGELARRVTPAPEEWLARWRARETQAAELLNSQPPPEAGVIEALTRLLPADSRLFTGNSLPVRQLDWFFRGRDKALTLYCNRGASGIDGNLSTLLGMASVSRGPMVGLLGDLTLLHDIGALQNAQGLDAVIVVLDNHGGGIFDHLPQATLEEHEALFVTPPVVDLASIAGGFGIPCHSCMPATFAGELETALHGSGVRILRVELERALSLEQHHRLWSLASKNL